MRKERLHAAISQEAQNRFLALRDVMCIRDFISGWFHGAPFESVHASDAAAFVAYGFMNSRLEDLSPQASTARSHAWAGQHHGCAWDSSFVLPHGRGAKRVPGQPCG